MHEIFGDIDGVDRDVWGDPNFLDGDTTGCEILRDSQLECGTLTSGEVAWR